MNLHTTLFQAHDGTGRVAAIKACGCALVAGPGLTITPCLAHQADYPDYAAHPEVADDAAGDAEWSEARYLQEVNHAHD